ncbi:AraC family transcriptional regulator [Roseibium sediminicola]
MARAIAAIHKDYTHALKVEDLARLAGMSVSAFYASFRELTGTTPLQFQKQLRLIEARRLLQADRLSVSSAAFQVGYESPTQFSREYSRQFGVSPRMDKGAGITAPGF